jgi:hypothetical protein
MGLQMETAAGLDGMERCLFWLGIGFWEGFIYRRRKQVGREGRREMIVD